MELGTDNKESNYVKQNRNKEATVQMKREIVQAPNECTNRNIEQVSMSLI